MPPPGAGALFPPAGPGTTDTRPRPAAGGSSKSRRRRTSPAERRLARAVLAALALAAIAFGPGARSSGLGTGDLLIAAVTLASGLALWGLGTLLHAERIRR